MSEIHYDPEAAEQFCRDIEEGDFVQNLVGVHGGVKIQDFFEWLEEVPEFRDRYNKALRRRALIFHERAVSLACGTNKNTVSADKVAIETLKWACSLADPEKYASKGVVKADQDSVIIIETGVRRDGDAGFTPPEGINESTDESESTEQQAGRENEAEAHSEATSPTDVGHPGGIDGPVQAD